MPEKMTYTIKVETKKGAYSFSARVVIPADAAKIMGIIPGEDNTLIGELDPDTKVLSLRRGKKN